ncbi:hypothetical protein J14TS2_42510 [Bacillus sp. J14TS2]|nr:hypothetical protein J14TS2_42510 [Bacillus sp. J14TS2]
MSGKTYEVGLKNGMKPGGQWQTSVLGVLMLWLHKQVKLLKKLIELCIEREVFLSAD